MKINRNVVSWFFIIVPVGFIILIIGFVSYAIYKVETRVYSEPIFYDGQIVKMKLSGDRGMVVRSNCYKICTYQIRFSSLQMNTDVSLFGSDGPINIAPVSLVRNVREFELEEGS